MPGRPLPAPLPEPRLDAAALRRLDAFLDLLLRWNARINLVADAAPEAIRTRHLADSLQLLSLLPDDATALADLGSGGGFPGLVLAAATDRPVHLVESDHRKAAFLTEAAARLGLRHVRVHATRIENLRLPPVGVVTARALAPLSVLLGHASRLLAPGGTAIFPKGRTASAELTAASVEWTFRAEQFASRTDPEATILRIHDIRCSAADA
ncbi:16S rRNA (guanine(527)-N(7))-methyltransferase RsmG [Falsiroseomonas sp. CW058]|uniref:16S rRNA (guanine(527)-N(7))-methyltransferase RsmG n=1 Tax=Falsiroseomonas sp. CW058 TaxID=3388664 RepID=UPI003D320D96